MSAADSWVPASHDPTITFDGARGQGERYVAREPHATVGPDVSAEPSGFVGALDDGGELGAADTGHHAGRAHRPRPDADLDDVGAGFDQLACAVGGDDVAGDDRAIGTRRPHLLDDVEHRRLVSVSGVDHQHVGADPGQLGRASDRVGVDPDRDRDQQAALGIERRSIDRRAQRADAGEQPEQTAVIVDDRRQRASLTVQTVECLLRT